MKCLSGKDVLGPIKQREKYCICMRKKYKEAAKIAKKVLSQIESEAIPRNIKTLPKLYEAIAEEFELVNRLQCKEKDVFETWETGQYYANNRSNGRYLGMDGTEEVQERVQRGILTRAQIEAEMMKLRNEICIQISRLDLECFDDLKEVRDFFERLEVEGNILTV